MIESKQIAEILSLYKKHGWNLSRVLISADLKDKLGKLEILFGETEIIDTKIDAVWFSRPAKNNRMAWELRHLDNNPFALFASFAENEDASLRENTLKELENRLRVHASNDPDNKKS